MRRLEAKLGTSSETLDIIRQEMERDYYSAELRLVDPLLTRCESIPTSPSPKYATPLSPAPVLRGPVVVFLRISC